VASDLAGAKAKGMAASAHIRKHFTRAQTVDAIERRLLALSSSGVGQPFRPDTGLPAADTAARRWARGAAETAALPGMWACRPHRNQRPACKSALLWSSKTKKGTCQSGSPRSPDSSQQALAACAAGLAVNPDDAELLFRQAMALRLSGDSDRAETCCRRILTLRRPEQFSSVDGEIYGHHTGRNLAALAR
jgi:hypothetical protein